MLKYTGEKPKTPEELLQEKIVGLETETALLWYESMVIDGRLDEETALLWYEIMILGGAS